jgi:hypothetical protein
MVLQSLIDLVLVPGSSLRLVPLINLSVVCLLVAIWTLSYTKIATVHLVVMTVLSLGLLLSVNFVLHEFNRIKEMERSGESSAAPAPTAGRQTRASTKKVD